MTENNERHTIMSPAEMQDFWNTLCSFSGEDIQNEMNLLKQKIRFPRFLYRYRAVNNNNLEALRDNRLFFSKASRYDDPFDTFLHINTDQLLKEFNESFDSLEKIYDIINNMKELCQINPNTPQELVQIMTTPEGIVKNIKAITLNFIAYVLYLRKKIQDCILSICFSENGFNETLWLKYADMHKGFCLMYDMSDGNSWHCGKKDRCTDCLITKYGMQLYPVYYSDEPHDATNFIKPLIIYDMNERLNGRIIDSWKQELKPFPWELERNSLIKKTCHKYDEEWRMILNTSTASTVFIEFVPAAVIIGLRTPEKERDLILSLAKEAGIKKVYQSFIDLDNKLNAYLIPDSTT